ncbi:MAG TPA: ROK family protein [Ktedonobacteraceae bacterium]|nr:ROK family protein [Ktedonobacteraceae bacterium]
MENAGYVGALDIGGTKMLAGIIDGAGELMARKRIETQAARGATEVIARAASLMRDLVQETGMATDNLVGIGCSVPGPLDSARGTVIFSPNLAWRDVPLAAMLSEALGVPVKIEDDARCAALGEARRGGARGAQNAVYVTISTGIGGGVIVNGRIYRGSHGCAGEVGHMTLDASGPPCACGNMGCFESLASGSAIAARARQAVLHGDETLLARFCGEPALLTAEQVIDAANRGDGVALRILETAAMYTGIGLAAIATACDPEVIVLGGGVIQPNGLFLRRAREIFQARVIAPLGSLVRIVPAELGDESGLWGAAALMNNNESLATRQVIDV